MYFFFTVGALCFFACLLPKICGELTAKTWRVRAMSLVHSALQTCLVLGMMKNPLTMTQEQLLEHVGSYRLSICHGLFIAYIYSEIICIWVYLTNMEIVHHLVNVIAVCLTIVVGAPYYLSVYAISTEMSTVFLNLRFLVRKKSAHLFLEGCFYITFTVNRIVLGSVILWKLLSVRKEFAWFACNFALNVAWWMKMNRHLYLCSTTA